MTQTKLISTPKSNILVIGGIPEGFGNFFYHKSGLFLDCDRLNNYGQKMYWMSDTLPSGNWQILGKLSEITEEQAGGIVDLGWYETRYNYIEMLFVADFTDLESFHSLMTREGIHIDNPYEMPYKGDYMTDGVVTISDAQSDRYYADLKRYEDAQRFTNPLILIGKRNDSHREAKTTSNS